MNDNPLPEKFFDVRFGALAIPGGISSQGRLKLTLCFTPRLEVAAGGQRIPQRNMYEKFAQAMESFITNTFTLCEERKDDNPAAPANCGTLGITFNGVAKGAVCVERHWAAVWYQLEAVALRKEIWRRLLHGAVAEAWPDTEPATAIQSVQNPQSGTAEQIARDGSATLETPGLDQLGRKVRETYLRVAEDLARAAGQPDQASAFVRQAHDQFTNMTRDFEVHLDRISSHGSISETDNSSAASRETSTTGLQAGDSFHTVFPRLQPYRCLQQFLGLLVDVELELDWKSLPLDKYNLAVCETGSAWLHGPQRSIAAELEKSSERFFLSGREWLENSQELAWLPFDALGISMQSLSARRAPKDKDSQQRVAAPPPLRGAGLSMVYKATRAQETLDAVKTPGPVLDFKELKIGDAVEVRRVVDVDLVDHCEDGGWSSLCRRQTILEIGAPRPEEKPLRLWWRRHSRYDNKERKQVWIERANGGDAPFPPASEVADDVVSLSLALSQAPQPLTGVVLKSIDSSSLVVATPIGDWIVEYKGDRAVEFAALRGEYHFSGHLSKANNVELDFRLVAVQWEKLGDARTGQLHAQAGTDELFQLEFAEASGTEQFREAVKIAKAPQVADGAGSKVPVDSFPIILSDPLSRAELQKQLAAQKTLNVVARGVSALSGETAQAVHARVVRILSVERDETDPALYKITVETDDFGRFPLWARTGEFAITGVKPLDPEAVSREPKDLPQHGRAWMEIIQLGEGPLPRILSAWLLGESRELIVNSVSDDQIVFGESNRWHNEHVLNKPAANQESPLQLRINLCMAGEQTRLAPVTIGGWQLVGDELLPGERLLARGRQLKDSFVPVHLERNAASELHTLGAAVAVRAFDEETFRVRLVDDNGALDGGHQWKFEAGRDGFKPRLLDLIWVVQTSEKDVARFAPATRPGVRKRSFWGRIGSKEGGRAKIKYVVTSRGRIPFPTGERNKFPDGTAIRLEVEVDLNQRAITVTPKDFRAMGVVLYRVAGESLVRVLGPLAGNRMSGDWPELPALAATLGTLRAWEKGGDQPAEPIVRILENPDAEPIVHARVLGWRTKGGNDLEPLPQSIDLAIDLAEFDSASRLALQKDNLLALTKAALRFRIDRPEETLLRSDEFKHGLVVDHLGGWRTIRTWKGTDATDLTATAARFDIICQQTASLIPGPLPPEPQPGQLIALQKYRVDRARASFVPDAGPLPPLPPSIEWPPLSVKRLPLEDQIFASDALFTWNHWSLVAPNPILKKTDEPLTNATDKAVGTPIVCVGEPPPGSLVPMRFGWSYDVRIRGVDLAGSISQQGNSKLSNACPPAQTVKVVRFDAMGAPLAMPTVRDGVLGDPHAYIPVETTDSREEPDSSEETEIILKSVWRDGRYELMRGAHERSWLLLPPPAGLDLLLSHGVLDGSEEKSFAALEEIRSAQEDASNGKFNYRTHPGILPYARDPLVKNLAVLIIGTPGPGNEHGRQRVVVLPLSGSWPRVSAAVLKARGDAAELRVKKEGAALHVFVPAGEVCDASISAAPDAEDLPLLAWWDWLCKECGARAEEIRTLVARGQHPLVSGARRVRIIHAVDRPSSEPVIDSIKEVGVRALGSQSVGFTCRIGYDPATTGCVTLHGVWDEYVDHVDRRYPSVPPEEARRCFDPLTEEMTEKQMADFLDSIVQWRRRQDGSDWWLHFGLEHPAEMKRFAKDAPWFWQAMREFATPSVGTATLLSKPFSRPEPGEKPKSFAFDFVHTFDDTCHRVVNYRARAFTCFTREFPDGPPVDSKETTTAAIAATTPPAVPDVAYVVPLFGREAGLTEQFVPDEPRRRKGMALRIYLRRPWYSSGKGEELAVVFSTSDRPDRTLRERVTEWGYDPVWYGPKDRGVYLPQPRAGWCLWNTSRTELALPRPAGVTGTPWKIEIASHAVRFSPVRGLWYCDVLLNDEIPVPIVNRGARPYLPFLRLALARYQVNALPAARLSDIVALDFIQLHPSRALVVRRTSPWSLHCRVSGPMPTGKGDGERRRIEAMVQSAPEEAAGWAEAVAANSWQELVRGEEHGQPCYAGEVALPRAGQNGLELIVRECELIDTADRLKEPRTIYAERVFIGA